MEPEAIAITETETYQTLLARAHRRTGGVPPESIVRHILAVTRGGDWPVQRDALDAVLRRCASTHTDEFRSSDGQGTGSSQQIADARLRDAENLRGLRLRQSTGGDRLLLLNQQVGANQQMLGFFGGEPEIAEDIARRGRDLQATFSWHPRLASRTEHDSDRAAVRHGVSARVRIGRGRLVDAERVSEIIDAALGR